MNILEEAMEIVDGDRQDDYGHPIDNHGTTSEMFASYLRRKYGTAAPSALDAYDTCIFNILQKVSRLANKVTRDGLTDLAGYARNMEMIMDWENALPRDAQVDHTEPSPEGFVSNRMG